MTSELVERFQVLKKFKTGTVILGIRDQRLNIVTDINVTGQQIVLMLLDNGLQHVVTFEELTFFYEPATRLAMTLYAIKGRKTY